MKKIVHISPRTAALIDEAIRLKAANREVPSPGWTPEEVVHVAVAQWVKRLREGHAAAVAYRDSQAAAAAEGGVS